MLHVIGEHFVFAEVAINTQLESTNQKNEVGVILNENLNVLECPRRECSNISIFFHGSATTLPPNYLCKY